VNRFCDCGTLAPGYGACPSCGKGPRRRKRTATSRGYGHRWREGLRKRQLHREPRCEWVDLSTGERCGRWAKDVDHIIPKSQGGADAMENLQSLCHNHHSMKTVRELRARRYGDARPLITSSGAGDSVVVHITGQVATGKSHVRAALAEQLDLPACSIDDERLKLLAPGEHWPWGKDAAAWSAVHEQLDEHPVAIFESLGAGRDEEQQLLAGRSVVQVHCTADPMVRRRRLEERVRSGFPMAQQPGYVDRVLWLESDVPHDAIAYDSTDGSDTVSVVDTVAERVASLVKAVGAVEAVA
jgi:5-methylcytosine-specific restriction protein A